MICNKRQLAEIFGVSEETLTRWAKLGCPIEKKGRGTQGSKYDTARAYAWRLALAEKAQEPADLENERVKLVRVQRELAELDLRERQGKLVACDLVEAHWAGSVVTLRARLLTLPHTAAPRLPVPSDRRGEAEAILRDLVHEALTELADDGVPADARESAASTVDA